LNTKRKNNKHLNNVENNDDDDDDGLNRIQISFKTLLSKNNFQFGFSHDHHRSGEYKKIIQAEISVVSTENEKLHYSLKDT
jgi:hypothetical protein